MKVRFFLSFSLCLTMFFGLCLSASGARYRPAGQVVVETVFSGFAGERLLTWRIVVESAAKESHRLAFYTGDQDVGATTTLALHESGEIERVELGQRGEPQQGVEQFLVQPGSPAPADILPVFQQEAEKKYAIEERAGGRVFRRSYRVVITEMSRAECVARGWLTATAVEDATSLRVITVYDEKNKAVAMQLWESAGDWWLYEQTPFRRSRLVR